MPFGERLPTPSPRMATSCRLVPSTVAVCGYALAKAKCWGTVPPASLHPAMALPPFHPHAPALAPCCPNHTSWKRRVVEPDSACASSRTVLSGQLATSFQGGSPMPLVPRCLRSPSNRARKFGALPLRLPHLASFFTGRIWRAMHTRRPGPMRDRPACGSRPVVPGRESFQRLNVPDGRNPHREAPVSQSI